RDAVGSSEAIERSAAARSKKCGDFRTRRSAHVLDEYTKSRMEGALPGRRRIILGSWARSLSPADRSPRRKDVNPWGLNKHKSTNRTKSASETATISFANWSNRSRTTRFFCWIAKGKS